MDDLASRPAPDEALVSAGIRIPPLPSLITPEIEATLRNGRYDGGKAAILRDLLREGDRVLDLGAGLGQLTAIAALTPGIGRVTAVEANPDLLPAIAETLHLNGVTGADLRTGVVVPEPGATEAAFHLRADFRSSSRIDRLQAEARSLTLPAIGLPDLVAELDPTVIVCEVKGSEPDLFDNADLSGVRAILLETHPRICGEAGMTRLARVLARKGLYAAPARRGKALLFERRPRPESFDLSLGLMPDRSYRPWPIRDPKVMIATCMKDEGPFILEWVAWHRAIGVTDIVVFTNDCSDGTDLLLDRLQDLGHVRHLPNPALAHDSTWFQPTALRYTHLMKEFREADFFISMDVDEFLNIRVGNGTLPDLFAATGPFDVLSMTEVNHGSNNEDAYRRGWVTELFPLHQRLDHGKLKGHRGVKSITRLSPNVEQIRNHRPDIFGDQGPVTWLNGSGKRTTTFMDDRGNNGADGRRTYDLVTLDHFPLRSLDSFLVKMFRGDVVVQGKSVSARYWRLRNKNNEQTDGLERHIDHVRDWHRSHLETDARLMALHDACCRAHERRIEHLRTLPDFVARREWVYANSWGTTVTPDEDDSED